MPWYPSTPSNFDVAKMGLCIPGLGFDQYDDMASALCMALPVCLKEADGRVKAMIADVEMRTRNGYKIVWNLLYRFVPGFDPTKMIDQPSWDDHKRDVIQYTVAFDSISGSAPNVAKTTTNSQGLSSSLKGLQRRI